MKTFALAGNPNSGKTTLFNALTGATAHVGNWPGVTVEQRKGVYRNKKAGIEANITDLPGIYSLSPYTPEEVISRNFILDEHPDAIIDIVDVTNLERNLYLTTQLLEMDVPVIVALNMMDALAKQGSSVNAEELSKKLGVPVVEISALKNENIEALMQEAMKLPEKRKGSTVLSKGWLGDLVKEAEAIYAKEEGIIHPLFHAIKALENDEIEAKSNKSAFAEVGKLIESKGKTADELEAASADGRYQVITENFATSLSKKEKAASEKLTYSDKVDKVLTNRWVGIPIFLILLYILFRITFAENLFFADFGIGTFDEGGVFEGLFYAEGHLMSLGKILANFVECVTGWFTGVVAGWMEGAGAWQSFVCDGILGGIFAVMGSLMIFGVGERMSEMRESRLKSFFMYVGGKTFNVLTWHMLSFKLVSLAIILIYSLPWNQIAGFPVIAEYASRGWFPVYFVIGVIVPIAWSYWYDKVKLKIKK